MRFTKILLVMGISVLLINACSETPTVSGRKTSSDGGWSSNSDAQSSTWQPGSDANPGTSNGALADVTQSDPYYSAITWAVEKGIIEVSSDNPPRFNPQGTFTRDYMAKYIIMVRFGKDFQYTQNSFFNDVSESNPNFKYIQKIKDERITAGCSSDGNKFCPLETTTKAHAASFIVRAKYNLDQWDIKSEQPYFNDVPNTHWGFRPIQKLEEDQAAIDCGENNFCPDNGITRAEVASMLYKYFGSSTN